MRSSDSLVIASAEKTPEKLLAAWTASRSGHTRRAYARDLDSFAAWLGMTAGAAVAELLGGGAGHANALVLDWQREVLDVEQLAAATWNRRLCALRSLVQLAGLLGIVAWRLEVPLTRDHGRRDTAGPGPAAVGATLGELAARADAKGLRDVAIVRLLADLALWVGEVVSLDFEHVTAGSVAVSGAVHILGKGRRRREAIALPAPTAAALRAWLEVRGSGPGPLFHGFTRHGAPVAGRLAVRSVQRMLEPHGIRPHGLRHTAITAVLEVSGGDVRAAAQYSRHADLRTLTVYDDNRRGHAARLAAHVAGLW